jgi:hypothetical protein
MLSAQDNGTVVSKGRGDFVQGFAIGRPCVNADDFHAKAADQRPGIEPFGSCGR